MIKVHTGTLLMLAALASCGSASVTGDIVGVYSAEGAELRVARQGDRLTATVTGNRAANGAAADCEVRAIGDLVGNTLVAQFIAFDAETFAYGEQSASADRRQLEIVFEDGRAVLKRIDIDAYCGVGARLVGTYQQDAPRGEPG